MKFKLDENLPELIHTTLVGLGHDARTLAEEQLAGATDDAVLRASIAALQNGAFSLRSISTSRTLSSDTRF